MASLDRRCLSLTTETCANHSKAANGRRDYCWREWTTDYRCAFATTDNARCRYFEESVLPQDPELLALCWAEHKARAAGVTLKAETLNRIAAAVRGDVPCAKCGKPFTPASNRQKYCGPCRQQVVNRQKSESKRRIAQGAI